MASGSRSIFEGSDETFLHECDVCKYNKKTSKAISFCTVCTEYLCMTCAQSHRGSKVSRDHTIVTYSENYMQPPSISKSLSPDIYCEHHKTMLLNVYCEGHGKVICGTCKLTDHKKCKTTDVKQQRASIKMKEAFDETLRLMMALKKKYEACRDSREQDKCNVKLQTTECFDDLKKFSQYIRDTLEKLEKKFEKEAPAIEQSIVKEIENHLTIADDALNQINEQIKSLEDCRKSKNDEIMFVCMNKALTLENKYNAAFLMMQEEISHIQIQFKPNDVITDVLIHLQSLGTIEKIKEPSYNKTSLLNMNVSEPREVDVGCPEVWDCTFIGDSHLVLACGEDGLKLLDNKLKVRSQLYVPAGYVAAIDGDEVIVSHSILKQLQRVSIFPDMAVTEKLKMNRRCYGVDVFNDEIYVACHDGPGNGEVRVLNMAGTLQRQFGVRDGQNMFTAPQYIKVSRYGSNIFISDWGTNKVTCLSPQGRVLYQSTEEDLKSPAGMYVDDEGTALVCGEESNKVVMIKKDGSKQKVLFSQTEVLKNPTCISFRPSDGRLVVGLGDVDKPLLVYQTKYK